MKKNLLKLKNLSFVSILLLLAFVNQSCQNRPSKNYETNTVDTHFKWMKEYGVDGFFMLRFFNAAKPASRKGHSTDVMKFALDTASKYDRTAVMYYLSGLGAKGKNCSVLIDDLEFIVNSLKLTNQKGAKTYLHHNGKPLVAIWRVGFPDCSCNIRNIGLQHFIEMTTRNI